LDNLSEEKEINTAPAPQILGLQEGEDIEFDETIDLDAIQKNLQRQMEEAEQSEEIESVAEVTEESVEFQEEVAPDAPEVLEEEAEYAEKIEPVEEIPEVSEDTSTLPKEKSEDISYEVMPILENIQPEVDSKAKKYVIYVNAENVDFVESLSINDRKILINKILSEQNELAKKRIELEKRARFFKHALVITFTVLIGFPLLFFLVNKSIAITIANYQHAQKNFQTLYREQGKIKQFAPKKVE